MRFVSGEGFVIDDVYITGVCPSYWGRDAVMRLRWSVRIKPLALDDILWAAFMPDERMGPRMRINRRINGAFQIQPLVIEEGSQDLQEGAEPDWESVLDQFESVRAGFIAEHPTPTEFVTALPDLTTSSKPEREQMLTALIAAGRADQAAELGAAMIARGEKGRMSGTVDVLKYLTAYAAGPRAYNEFCASLTPTHEVTRLSEGDHCLPIPITRVHHRGNLLNDLARLDGVEHWAVILRRLPPASAECDPAAERYLQAAGSSEAMVVEIRQPGGEEFGAVSVRNIVGHGHAEAPLPRDVAITLPESVEMITADEVFTATEAADVFEFYYHNDTLPPGCSLRPAEGYTVSGGLVYPPEAKPPGT
jgi:hypothetical protein